MDFQAKRDAAASRQRASGQGETAGGRGSGNFGSGRTMAGRGKAAGGRKERATSSQAGKMGELDYAKVWFKKFASFHGVARFEQWQLTPLPKELVEPLKKLLRQRQILHDKDVDDGTASVWLPRAIGRKYPNAHQEFRWQYQITRIIQSHTKQRDAQANSEHDSPPASLGSAPRPRSSKLDPFVEQITQLLER